MSWFEDWFDSPLYDALYADRNQQEAEQTVALLSRYLPAEQYRSLLDLGCGRGRHAITLARQGYQVTGIDLSPKSIEHARRLAKTENLEDHVTFHIGDMRNKLNGTFDAVLNLFTSFGYFDDDEQNRKVIGNMASMTRSNGRVVIDFLNADRVTSNLKPEEQGSLEGADYEIRRYIDGDTIVKEISFQKTGDSRCIKFEERVKAYRRDWFTEAFSEYGLNLLETFGNYEGQTYYPEESPRLILIAEKQ